MPNPCGTVHMPNMACRECDRIRAKSNRIDVIKSGKAPPLVAHISVQHDPDDFGEIKAPKQDRLEVAHEALTAAERQKRHREKDPEAYRKWNRERMRRIRGSPKSPEE